MPMETLERIKNRREENKKVRMEIISSTAMITLNTRMIESQYLGTRKSQKDRVLNFI